MSLGLRWKACACTTWIGALLVLSPPEAAAQPVDPLTIVRIEDCASGGTGSYSRANWRRTLEIFRTGCSLRLSDGSVSPISTLSSSAGIKYGSTHAHGEQLAYVFDGSDDYKLHLFSSTATHGSAPIDVYVYPVFPLTLEATRGASVATLSGNLRIAHETPSGAGYRLLEVADGTTVPFTVTYTLPYDTWDELTFERGFEYAYEFEVDLENPTSAPAPVELTIKGATYPARDGPTPYWGRITYDNGYERSVPYGISWTVDEIGLSATSGVFELDLAACTAGGLTLRAAWSDSETSLEAQRSIDCDASGGSTSEYDWTTFGAGARRSGHVPSKLLAGAGRQRWSRQIFPGYVPTRIVGWNEVALVVVRDESQPAYSVAALDSATGDILWTAESNVERLAGLTIAHGNLYIHECDHGRLRVVDLSTGQLIYQLTGLGASTLDRSARTCPGPAVVGRQVLFVGGDGLVLHAHDAYSGELLWSHETRMTEPSTPSGLSDRAVLYENRNNRGRLAVFDTETGTRTHWIARVGWPSPPDQGTAAALDGARSAVVIDAGNLVVFDLWYGSISRTLLEGFEGQPAVRGFFTYALRFGELIAFNNASGETFWTWSAPDPPLIGGPVLTDSHVFVWTESATYALDLEARSVDWSAPRSGDVSLANGNLYISTYDGWVVAYAMPHHPESDLIGLAIEGPSTVEEMSTASFDAIARYSSGQELDVTLLTDWSVAPQTYASIDESGGLQTRELFVPMDAAVVGAVYEEGGHSAEASKPIELVIGVDVDEFVRRNLAEASAITAGVLEDLDEAALREQAAEAVLQSQQGPTGRHRGWWRRARTPLQLLRQAIFWNRMAREGVDRGLEDVDQSLEAHEAETAAQGGR